MAARGREPLCRLRDLICQSASGLTSSPKGEDFWKDTLECLPLQGKGDRREAVVDEVLRCGILSIVRIRNAAARPNLP